MAEFGQFLIVLGNVMIALGVTILTVAVGAIFCIKVAEHLFNSDD